ncbi:MAG: AraC family transcriptional regulator [Betaproteobacteria bacterium]|nr:AraC family transcriptional regulator [Betaproteobacteria bacterium]MDH4294576.1 AraC family transcriptional regulator [Betaproteobacteria bacterium]MDH5341493.1 AraC family transcriptional regulator [Betaproteobacteria bacterium]
MRPGKGVGASVRVGGAAAIPEVLRSLGADPAKVFTEAKVSLDLFDDPENLIGYADRSRLIAICVARTGCRHFGFLVGKAGGLHSLGLVGYLVRHSPNVGTALRNLVRYMHLHVRGALPTLTVEGKQVFLGYAIYQPGVDAVYQTTEGAIAVACNIMRALCGPDWNPAEVRFVHRKPADVEPYRRFFRTRPRFNADRNAMVFPADWLTRPVLNADRQLHGLLQKQVDTLDASSGLDFAEQVRRILRTALLTGHTKADQVGMLLGVHSRTLNRRLHACGTSFQELLDEGRYTIARQMLESTKGGVNEIAAALGYADGSSFTRAFRRWSGTTPAGWRKTAR